MRAFPVVLVLALWAVGCAHGPAASSTRQQETAPQRTPGEVATLAFVKPFLDRCATGDAVACRPVLVRVQAARTDAEATSYLPALKLACDRSVLAACAAVSFQAIQREAGATAELDRLRSLCEQNQDSAACSYLIDAEVHRGNAFPDVVQKYEAALRQSCTHAPGPSCTNVAQKELAAGNVGSAQLGLIDRGCDGGDGMACYQLGQVYDQGAGDKIAKDPKEARRGFQRACDLLWPEGCYDLAWQLKNAGDAKGFDELAQKACGLGDSKACDDLAQIASEAGDSQAPERYCALWGANACYAAAAGLVKDKDHVDAVARGVVEFSATGCMRGSTAGCNVLGHLLEQAAAQCEKEDATSQLDGCALTAEAFARGVKLPPGQGKSVPQDRAQAARAFERSCHAGSATSCARNDELSKGP
ncbi:MAG: hypothetical protein ACJ790_14195 [Myxococcaceae bacterium]